MKELDLAKKAVGNEDDREQRRTDAGTKVTQVQTKGDAAKKAHDDLAAAAPDIATAKANLAHAKGVVEGVAARLKKLGEQRSGLSAAISIQAANGVEERRDEVLGRLDAVRIRCDLFAAEVAALTHLRTIIQATRLAAKETYFGPVQQELTPLLQILHSEAALSFDANSMLATMLQRGHTEEEMGALSSGTQEQIAILTRLAFANLLSKQGKTLPIILDDALVYSDDDRIIKMFTALHRIALNQQIIVFSCRQLAFVGLGGTRPELKVMDVA